MKKCMALLLAALLALSLTACGGAAAGADAKSSDEKLLVGHWSTDYEFTDDTYENIEWGSDYGSHYVELFSDGTGRTDAYGSLGADGFTALQWELRAPEEIDDAPEGTKVLVLYLALECDETEEQDPNGFYILPLPIFEEAFQMEQFHDKDGNTVYAIQPFGRNEGHYLKEENYPGFEDKRPAGYEKAWESLELYRKDIDAYYEQLIPEQV